MERKGEGEEKREVGARFHVLGRRLIQKKKKKEIRRPWPPSSGRRGGERLQALPSATRTRNDSGKEGRKKGHTHGQISGGII